MAANSIPPRIDHDPGVARSGLTRRKFVAGAGGVVLSSAFPLTSVAARARRLPLARAGRFASGVASGDPFRHGALLWTRLHGVEADALVRLEVAADPEFRRVVDRQLVRAFGERDFTVKTRVNRAALRPGERYWYRFATRTTSSPVGRLQTLRPPDSREPVRIGFFSCQRYEHGWFTPHDALAREDLDAVVSLGDFIYEEDSGAKVPQRKQETGKPNGHVETLAQWRAKHSVYRSDAALQRTLAAHTLLCIWDDCEVEGNWAGQGPSSGPSPVGARSIPFAAKRANGIRTFFEWMPLRTSGAERHRIYRQVPFGRNAELFLLDTRQYRDPQPCHDATLQEPEGATCFEESEPGRTFLGGVQKRWLLDRLPRSRATWKVLGNAQMMMALDLPAGRPVQRDPWDGYDAERREVLEGLRTRGVRNLVSVVGDVHTFFAGDLTTTGRVGGNPIGTEFVGSSISHDGLGIDPMPQATFNQLADQLPAQNPHLRYAKFGVRGYGVIEARPDELRARFKAVDTVLAPQSRAYDLARFRVARDDPRVQTA